MSAPEYSTILANLNTCWESCRARSRPTNGCCHRLHQRPELLVRESDSSQAAHESGGACCTGGQAGSGGRTVGKAEDRRPSGPSSRHHQRCSRRLTRSHQLPTFCSERQNAQQTSSPKFCFESYACNCWGEHAHSAYIYPVCVIPHPRPALELTLFNPSA